MDSEKVEKIVGEIKERTKVMAYSLVIDLEKQPEIFDSKFGGLPYWDLNKDYPIDSKGNKLMMLAQINLDRIEADDMIPKEGMLQFFIGTNDIFGMDFDEPDKQDAFRVIYHECIDYSVSKEQIEELNIPVCTDSEMEEYSPVFREAALDISKKEIYMGPMDYRFEQLFEQIAMEKYEEDISGSQFSYGELDDKCYEFNMGHWLLGYPYFTQTDPREYEEKYRYYDTLLFQMDSDYVMNEDYVLWGDCGVGNFFINSEDLKNRDFSKILYNWDCC